jgi:hypothetical protein
MANDSFLIPFLFLNKHKKNKNQLSGADKGAIMASAFSNNAQSIAPFLLDKTITEKMSIKKNAQANQQTINELLLTAQALITNYYGEDIDSQDILNQITNAIRAGNPIPTPGNQPDQDGQHTSVMSFPFGQGATNFSQWRNATTASGRVVANHTQNLFQGGQRIINLDNLVSFIRESKDAVRSELDNANGDD